QAAGQGPQPRDQKQREARQREPDVRGEIFRQLLAAQKPSEEPQRPRDVEAKANQRQHGLQPAAAPSGNDRPESGQHQQVERDTDPGFGFVQGHALRWPESASRRRYPRKRTRWPRDRWSP